MGGKLTRQWGQKIILQGRVNRLFGKEPQIKINVRFFDLLLGGDFSAIQIVNWRDVRSLSFNFLQVKKNFGWAVSPLLANYKSWSLWSLMRRAFNRLSVSEIKTETVSSPSTKRRRRRINLFFRNTCSLRKLLHLLWEKTIDSSLMNSFKNFHQSWRLAKEGKKRKWQSIHFSIDVQKSLSFKR